MMPRALATPGRDATTADGPLTHAYLSSAPHAGSTTIVLLLGAHPEVSTVGEFGATIERDLAYFEARAGAINRRYGYGD